MIDLREEARRVPVAVAGSSDLFAAARDTWFGRMVNEHSSAAVFAGLAEQLRPFDAAAADTCAGFAEEERHHGVLCGAVLEAIGGEATFPAPATTALPVHADVPAREAALRNVLAICCLAETVAVALIGAERLEMADGPIRRVLSDILADEVGHARFGWRWLAAEAPRLDAATRARLGRYLEVAFGHLETHEHANLRLGGPLPAGAADLGLCDAGAQRALFRDTVETVIVPRLEAHGLPARAAWASRRNPG